MAFRFVALVAALACVNMVSAVRRAPCSPCPRPLPEIHPTVVQSVVPAPVTIGPQAPGVIEHCSAPYEINYFGKPWVVKHQQSAALNVFAQTPVVVDEYAPPAFHEGPAPPAVVVEEVCGAPIAATPSCGSGYGNYGYGAAGYGSAGYGSLGYGSSPVFASPIGSYY